MTSFDFFPFAVPTYTQQIFLPEDFTTFDTTKAEELKDITREKTFETNIDLKRLEPGKVKNPYSIKELKSIAKSLKIKNASSMNKENLIKFIKLKLKK